MRLLRRQDDIVARLAPLAADRPEASARATDLPALSVHFGPASAESKGMKSNVVIEISSGVVCS